ncbi:MAG: hypothetical protein U5L75_02830 [Candidatus Campbellbacteria bacterium]|nr:hypothetical protein [Candidatus Campbellbacteria bacterium]
MVTNELLSFIQTRLNEGASRQEIESVLMSQGGWSKEDVDEAFDVISEQSQESTEEVPTRSHSSAVGSGDGKQPNNSRGIPTSVLIGGGVVLVGVILFFVLGPVLGMRYNAPNDIEGFLADFIENSQKVESFTYDVSLSIAQEPRGENAEPFDITDPIYESRLEDVEDDIELFDGVKSIRRDLNSHERLSGSFPASLAEIGTFAEVDTDSLDYQRTDGGSGYELAVQFETEEVFDYLKEDIEGEHTDGTITFTQDTSDFFFLSANRVLYKSSFVGGLEGLNMTAISLPARFNGDVSFSGIAGLEEEDTELPDMKNSLSADVDWGDLTVKVDAESLIKDEKIYARVNHFPSIFFFDIEPIRERWISIPEEEISNNMLSSVLPSDTSESEEEYLSESPRMLSNAVSEHNPFVLNGSPQKKELEDGRNAIGYSLGINADSFPEFYEVLMSDIISKLTDEEQIAAEERALEHDLAFFETEEFTELVEYLNEHVDFTIWMDERTGYPIQYSTEVVFVPNPEAIPEDEMFFGPPQASSDTQLRLVSKVTLSDINQRIDIQAPDDPLTFDEAAELMFGSRVIEDRKATIAINIRADIQQVRSEAELYYSDNSLSYEGFCDSDRWQEKSEEISELSSDVSASCYDSADAWAAEATLSGGGVYCADSTGFAGEVEEPTAEDYSCD